MRVTQKSNVFLIMIKSICLTKAEEENQTHHSAQSKEMECGKLNFGVQNTSGRAQMMKNDKILTKICSKPRNFALKALFRMSSTMTLNFPQYSKALPILEVISETRH